MAALETRRAVESHLSPGRSRMPGVCRQDPPSAPEASKHRPHLLCSMPGTTTPVLPAQRLPGKQLIQGSHVSQASKPVDSTSISTGDAYALHIILGIRSVRPPRPVPDTRPVDLSASAVSGDIAAVPDDTIGLAEDLPAPSAAQCPAPAPAVRQAAPSLPNTVHPAAARPDLTIRAPVAVASAPRQYPRQSEASSTPAQCLPRPPTLNPRSFTGAQPQQQQQQQQRVPLAPLRHHVVPPYHAHGPWGRPPFMPVAGYVQTHPRAAPLPYLSFPPLPPGHEHPAHLVCQPGLYYVGHPFFAYPPSGPPQCYHPARLDVPRGGTRPHNTARTPTTQVSLEEGHYLQILVAAMKEFNWTESTTDAFCEHFRTIYPNVTPSPEVMLDKFRDLLKVHMALGQRPQKRQSPEQSNTHTQPSKMAVKRRRLEPSQ